MRFSKWHALGNSYLVVERAELRRPLGPERARLLCDVRYGIGADGVLEIARVDVRGADIVIWNPDGSIADFSGNGTRIAAMWLFRRTGAHAVLIRIGDRAYAAERRSETRVEMNVGPAEVAETVVLDLPEERIELTPVSVGNPHAVVRREPLRDDLLRLGPLIERHELFPQRTNVQFVRVDGRNALTVVVWERGAGETSSSGSSAVAAAAAAVVSGWCESPVAVRMPGGELEVALDGDNRATLTGPAEEICRGETEV
jgi:diaminopimelate epimerase